MEERAAAAGDDLHPRAEGLAAVVMRVARQHEEAVFRDAEIERLERLLSGGVRLEHCERRIGHAEDEPARGVALLREEAALREVDEAELAVDTPEVHVRRDAEAPVAR